MATAIVPQFTTESLDDVVEQICVLLQISPTQFELDRGH